MLTLRRPTPAALDRFRAAQAALDFTYPAVGATAAEPPAGYVVDRTRARLGDGEAVFAAARAALERWEQFRLGWVEATPADAPLRPGAVDSSSPAPAGCGGRTPAAWCTRWRRIPSGRGRQTRVLPTDGSFAFRERPDH